MKRVLIYLTLALLALLAGCTSRTTSPGTANAGLSDRQYMALAKNTSEARAFLMRYPSAEVYVDDDPAVLNPACLLGVRCPMAVDFRVTARAPLDTTQLWEGIRLRVYLDSRTGKSLGGSILQCNEKILDRHVIAYLDQYYQTGLCP